MEDDHLRLTIKIAERLEDTLGPLGAFFEKKVVERIVTQVAGNIYAIPEKISGLLPLALRQIGYREGDPVYDLAVQTQEAFDRDLLSGTELDPDAPDHPRRRIIIDDPGHGPDPNQTIVFGVVDP